MKIILSPAKKMKEDPKSIEYKQLPVYIKEAEEILVHLKELSYKELQQIWKCSDKIAQENHSRLENMDLEKNLTPAVLCYEGLAYQHMAPAVFENQHLEYIEDKLRILSGFYGMLSPMDGVTPYRLEMQAKLEVAGCGNLYHYWGKKIYDQIVDESRVIINLASKEYSKAVEKYLCEDDIYITCVFGQIKEGKVVQQGTYAKMARGEMVRFMAERKIEDPEEIKEFNRLGFVFSKDHSSKDKYVFIREV
jgi:cytoplasmic iron level regulating protein YaaA (DUF328/UPF0246 family)